MSAPRFASFAEFWPYYLGEHRRPVTRALHFVGTALLASAVVAAAVTMRPLFALAGVVGVYACAWPGHFFIEKNRPATFTYPLWSVRGDFKMFGLFVAGRLGAELAKLPSA